MSNTIYTNYSDYKNNYVLPHPKYDPEKVNFTKVDDRQFYVYRITNTLNGMHYYGSRVSSGPGKPIIHPRDDLGTVYFSSTHNDTFKEDLLVDIDHMSFKIVKIFDNNGDKICYESFLHQFFDVRRSGNSFYNKANAYPWGWDTTGMTEIHKDAGKKSAATKNKINPETGTSIAQDSAKKMSATRNKVNPETGLTGYQETGKKISTTRNKINPDTGLTGYQEAGKDISATRNKINPETGTSIAQDSAKKTASVRNKVNPETGLTGYQEAGKKIAHIMWLKNPIYYVTPWGKYKSLSDIPEYIPMSTRTIKNNCINTITIGASNISRSKYWTHDDLGKTSTELGFYIE